jgi:aspartate carbamoyltransferase regulatory subunit
MSIKDKTQLQVSAIKNGTVIDHIPAKNLFKVISILGLNKIDTLITFGTNLESKRLGKKAIIKIADVFFHQDEINKISLVAPDAKLNIIRDYEVVEKKVVTVPDTVTGITKCFNPKCITNSESIKTKFYVVEKKSVTLRCHYCEKIMNEEHFVII